MPRLLSALWRSNRRWLVFLTAGLFLHTQLGMAAQACMLPKAAPEPASVAMAECDGVPMDNDACVARCLAGDKAATSTDHWAPVVAVPFAVPLRLALADHSLASAQASAIDVPRGPPPRILFCTYRT